MLTLWWGAAFFGKLCGEIPENLASDLYPRILTGFLVWDFFLKDMCGNLAVGWEYNSVKVLFGKILALLLENQC